LDEIELFRKEWGSLGAKVLVKEFYRGADQVEEIPKDYAPASFVRCGDRFPCIELWTRGGVQWNGDFVVCCMDFDGNSKMGNLSKESLAEVWNSSSMLKLRKEHIENNYINPLCKNCKEWRGSQKDIYYPFSQIFAFTYENCQYLQKFNHYFRRFYSKILTIVKHK
jgi:radical SAM protein with 4Fe4S-binding SPASM domain